MPPADPMRVHPRITNDHEGFPLSATIPAAWPGLAAVRSCDEMSPEVDCLRKINSSTEIKGSGGRLNAAPAAFEAVEAAASKKNALPCLLVRNSTGALSGRDPDVIFCLSERCLPRGRSSSGAVRH